MKPIAWLKVVAVTILTAGALCPPQALAQVPARFYWKSLEGGNGVPLIYNSISGNTNPFDSSHQVTPGANFDASLALAGYAHNFSIADRAATAGVIVPMGRIQGDVTAGGKTAKQTAQGFGDPTLELTVNVIGPKAQKNIPDAMRYQPGFSLDLLADLVVPIGEYDGSKQLNIGHNRWSGRLGAPIVWQLGPWVPGRRTTLEFLPAVWVFGENDNFVGQKMTTKPIYQLDAHLTRDFTRDLWGAVDMSYYNGGQATINGVQGSKLNNTGVGFTLGYTVNENLNLTVGYKSTINDSAPTAMRMDGFMVSLVFGWHPLIEGMRRLKE